MDGVLEPAGDRWRLRFTRTLHHAPDKVWRALTDPEHLSAWFPHRIDGEWTVGAPLRFVGDFGDFDGQVLAFQPPSLLEFRWGPDAIRFEIAPDTNGCTLTLIDTFDEYGKASRDAAGWHECLDALDHHLAGLRRSSSTGERWRGLNAMYADRFGPEAATIGPPEGWEETVGHAGD